MVLPAKPKQNMSSGAQYIFWEKKQCYPTWTFPVKTCFSISMRDFTFSAWTKVCKPQKYFFVPEFAEIPNSPQMECSFCIPATSLSALFQWLLHQTLWLLYLPVAFYVVFIVCLYFFVLFLFSFFVFTCTINIWYKCF